MEESLESEERTGKVMPPPDFVSGSRCCNYEKEAALETDEGFKARFLD